MTKWMMRNISRYRPHRMSMSRVRISSFVQTTATAMLTKVELLFQVE